MMLAFSESIKGKPTYFVKKIQDYFPDHKVKGYRYDYYVRFGKHIPKPEFEVAPKVHTIRRDKTSKWCAGKNIDFVINKDTKKQFRFLPVVICLGVQQIKIMNAGTQKQIWVDGNRLGEEQMAQLILNDGFDCDADFWAFFEKDLFEGRLIHWTMLRY